MTHRSAASQTHSTLYAHSILCGGTSLKWHLYQFWMIYKHAQNHPKLNHTNHLDFIHFSVLCRQQQTYIIQICMIYHIIDKSSTDLCGSQIIHFWSPNLPQHGLMCRDHMPALRTNCLFYNVNLLKSLWLPNHFCLCMYGKGVNYEWCGATQESPPICPARACSYAMGTQVLVKHHTQTMY